MAALSASTKRNRSSSFNHLSEMHGAKIESFLAFTCSFHRGNIVRQLSFCVLALVTASLLGCTSGGDFPTAPVTGRVICEGKPVPHVMVFFEPTEVKQKRLTGQAGFAIAKEDGTFRLTSFKEGDGAVVGHHRVRVGLPHPQDHPNFKCDCYLNSEVDLMEVDVKKGKNEFELVLKKKTGREPPIKRDD